MGEKDSKDDPKPDPSKLGDAGKAALEEERRARREADRKLKEANDRLKELEDKDKSETERAVAAKAAAERERDEAKAQLLRIEIGAAKGLTPTQARRLVGSTKEELEADADDLLRSFSPNADDGKGDGGRTGDGKGGTPAKPTEDLKGGGDPTSDDGTNKDGGADEKVDPKKLAESVPRY